MPTLPLPVQSPCPQCGRSCLFAPDNPWRPFCSRHCRTIDLGAWASEEFRINAGSEMNGQEPQQ